MKSCLYRILSLSCVIALFGDGVSAKISGSASRKGSIVYEENYGSGGYDLGGASSASQKETQKKDLFPFTESQGRIENEDVVGIRISGKEIVLLGKNNTYFRDQGQNQDFSAFDFFSKYPKLLSVDISNMNLTKEMLQSLQMNIPETITSLIVNSCTIANKDFEDFTDIIKKCKQNLESLTVINTNLAQAESAKLIKVVEDLEVIRFLNLTLGELGDGGCKDLKETLLKSKDTLSELNLGFMKVDDNGSCDKMLASLGELRNLKKLEYSVIESTEKQVENFISSLAKLTKLTNLKIYFDDFSSHNVVKARGNADSLKEVMKNLRNLASLDISNMNLPDAVLQVISMSLGELTELQTLNISGNPINTRTAKVLSESLKSMDNLVVLIANNCEINDEAFSALCGGLQNSSLQYVYFSGNNIVGSVKSLPISQMKSLTAVDFARNKIKLSDVVGFMKTIPEGSKLEIVNWGGNDFGGISESQRTEEMDKLKIWKREHRVNTLDLGI